MEFITPLHCYDKKKIQQKTKINVLFFIYNLKYLDFNAK